MSDHSEIIPNKVKKHRKKKNTGREQSSDIRYRVTGVHTTINGVGIVGRLVRKKKK
jgi:hypothetical protein